MLTTKDINRFVPYVKETQDNMKVVDQTHLEGFKMERDPKLKEAFEEAKATYLAKKALKEEATTTVEESSNEEVKEESFIAASLINALIQDEWQAIQGYNDAIATFVAHNICEDTVNIFRDIVAEENIHIGQLQKALEFFTPSTQEIEQGRQEGAEQLEVQE